LLDLDAFSLTGGVTADVDGEEAAVAVEDEEDEECGVERLDGVVPAEEAVAPVLVSVGSFRGSLEPPVGEGSIDVKLEFTRLPDAALIMV
jgi:hypothetical protein